MAAIIGWMCLPWSFLRLGAECAACATWSASGLPFRKSPLSSRRLPGTSARACEIRLAIWASPRSGAGRSVRSSQGRIWPCRSVVARMRKVTRGRDAGASGAGTSVATRKSSLTAVSAMGQGCLTSHTGSLRVPPPGHRAKAARGPCLFLECIVRGSRKPRKIPVLVVFCDTKSPQMGAVRCSAGKVVPSCAGANCVLPRAHAR